MSDTMNNYSIQDGCHNCKHVFVRREFESSEEYYCTFEALPRPPCDSVYLGEIDYRGDVPRRHLDAQLKAWDDWERTQIRDRAGKCDDWKKQ